MSQLLYCVIEVDTCRSKFVLPVLCAPKELEILICDVGQTCGSAARARKYIGGYGFPCTWAEGP